MLGGNIRTTQGPHTFGTYLWVEFDNLAKVERKLIEGPYIHHMSEISGHHADILKEFCKFIPELIYDDINEYEDNGYIMYIDQGTGNESGECLYKFRIPNYLSDGAYVMKVGGEDIQLCIYTLQ